MAARAFDLFFVVRLEFCSVTVIVGCDIHFEEVFEIVGGGDEAGDVLQFGLDREFETLPNFQVY